MSEGSSVSAPDLSTLAGLLEALPEDGRPDGVVDVCIHLAGDLKAGRSTLLNTLGVGPGLATGVRRCTRHPTTVGRGLRFTEQPPDAPRSRLPMDALVLLVDVRQPVPRGLPLPPVPPELPVLVVLTKLDRALEDLVDSDAPQEELEEAVAVAKRRVRRRLGRSVPVVCADPRSLDEVDQLVRPALHTLVCDARCRASTRHARLARRIAARLRRPAPWPPPPPSHIVQDVVMVGITAALTTLAADLGAARARLAAAPASQRPTLAHDTVLAALSTALTAARHARTDALPPLKPLAAAALPAAPPLPGPAPALPVRRLAQQAKTAATESAGFLGRLLPARAAGPFPTPLVELLDHLPELMGRALTEDAARIEAWLATTWADRCALTEVLCPEHIGAITAEVDRQNSLADAIVAEWGHGDEESAHP